MKRDVIEIECEECGKIQREVIGRFGGHLFPGWIQVIRCPSFSKEIVNPEGHYCSDNCLMTNLQKRLS
jgi:hypothetical protein